MDSGLNIKDFEYFVSDSNGRKGFKDGKEYPISEEDWQKANPKHRDIECVECTFVSDKETLFLHNISREDKENVDEEPKFVGKFNMFGWIGHSSFYLFKCKFCKEIVLDYPHGYRGDFMYLRCDRCKEEVILVGKRYKDVYDRDGFHWPVRPSFRDLLKLLFKS